MNLSECALTDLEQQDAQEILQFLDTKIPSVNEADVARSLVDVLKLHIYHPIKLFATTHWIHSKGLTLTSLYTDPAFLEAVNASNTTLARIRKKVPGVERKRHHITRIEQILQRPLEQVFTPWIADSLPQPFDLAVNCLSSLENAIGLASHLSLEELCRQIDEAVNGDSVEQSNWRRKIGNGQKPLKKHFDAFAARLQTTLSSTLPITEPLFSPSQLNQRLRRKLRSAKQGEQGTLPQLGRGSRNDARRKEREQAQHLEPEEVERRREHAQSPPASGLPIAQSPPTRQPQVTRTHRSLEATRSLSRSKSPSTSRVVVSGVPKDTFARTTEEDSPKSIEHARHRSKALSDYSQDDPGLPSDLDDSFTLGDLYQPLTPSPVSSRHGPPKTGITLIEEEFLPSTDEESSELREDPIEDSDILVDREVCNSHCSHIAKRARFLPTFLTPPSTRSNSHSSLSENVPPFGPQLPPQSLKQSSVNMTTVPNDPRPPPPSTAVLEQALEAHISALSEYLNSSSTSSSSASIDTSQQPSVAAQALRIFRWKESEEIAALNEVATAQGSNPPPRLAPGDHISPEVFERHQTQWQLWSDERTRLQGKVEDTTRQKNLAAAEYWRAQKLERELQQAKDYLASIKHD